jgi:hypothetical protein
MLGVTDLSQVASQWIRTWLEITARRGLRAVGVEGAGGLERHWYHSTADTNESGVLQARGEEVDATDRSTAELDV